MKALRAVVCGMTPRPRDVAEHDKSNQQGKHRKSNTQASPSINQQRNTKNANKSGAQRKLSSQFTTKLHEGELETAHHDKLEAQTTRKITVADKNVHYTGAEVLYHDDEQRQSSERLAGTSPAGCRLTQRVRARKGPTSWKAMPARVMPLTNVNNWVL